MDWDWWEVTREERFFVSCLYHDICRDKSPFEKAIRKHLNLSDDISITSQAYEFCFFRDLAFCGKIKRVEEDRGAFEKQTFDLMVTLSDGTLIVVEAKAQQGFKSEQLKYLKKSKKMITDLLPSLNLKKVLLIPLYSSLYSPIDKTLNYFDVSPGLQWINMAKLYPDNFDIYQRADQVYQKKKGSNGS